MKKIFLILFFLIFDLYFCIAQPAQGNDRIEAIKMAYITKQLNLTPEEAQKFWPVYNNYTNELRQARQQYPNDVVGFEDKAVNIRKKYQGEFKKALGNNDIRVNNLFLSERNYRELLRSELQKRQQMRQEQPNRQFQRKPHPPR